MKYIRICIKTIHALFYLLFTSLIPKQRDLWVFGSWKGRSFSDNSKELFKYVSEQHPEINAVWIAKTKEVFEEVKTEGYNVAYYPSKRAEYYIKHAAINVQTESNEDTGRFRVGRTKIIQLFHGYGAVKEAHLYAGMGPLKKAIVKIYADDHSKSYWMVPAEYFVKRCSELFETNTNKMYITGQPRIDLLLRKMDCPHIDNYIKDKNASKLLLYMPTHRQYGQNNSLPFSMSDWESVNNYLTCRNFIMFFKPHPLEVKKYKMESFDFSNIVLLSGLKEFSDPYEYIHYIDLLITDYSSIAADYLVLDRPVIHFMYDIDSFDTEDYKLEGMQFVSGPICRTWDEVFSQVDSIFLDDQYHELRMSVRKQVMKYPDANNCERVYKCIINNIL